MHRSDPEIDSPPFFLCRHGETEWNTVGRRQGQLDSPLTEAGRGHADAIASAVASVGIDLIISSPLGRAVQTAAVVSERLPCPTIISPDLAEVHHGHHAGLTNTEIERRFPGQLGSRERDKYRWQFPGGESYVDAERRADRFLRSLAESEARRPLVVTHEMISRMLLRSALGLSVDEALGLSLPHGTVLRVEGLAAVEVDTTTSPGAGGLAFPILTRRTRLRPLAEGDVAAVHSILGDDATTADVSFGQPDLEATASYVERRMKQQQDHGFSMWAVELLESGEVVGLCGFFPGDDRELELGYVIRADHWGKGLATEAVSAAIDAAKAGDHRVYATIRPTNLRSLAVAGRVGLIEQGQMSDDRGTLLVFRPA